VGAISVSVRSSLLPPNLRAGGQKPENGIDY
jgi:hypothetical protein